MNNKKMKLTFPITFLLGLSYTAGECPGTIQTTSCDLSSLSAQLTGCDLATELGISASDLSAEVTSICADVSVETLSWEDVTNESGNPRNYQFDDNYFDGGTTWNDGTGTTVESLHAGDAGSIIRTYNNHATSKIIEWPNEYPYGKNFADCEARVAMCCFTESRLEDLPINADVCYHDLYDSSDSNHIKYGIALFKENGQKAYCTGFSWEDDEESISAKYKGNALFYTSMYENFYNNGYVKNAPSSPLCACVEQMATVTNADCVKVSAVEGGFKFSIDLVEKTLTVNEMTEVTYSDCDGGSLIDNYKSMATDEEVAELTTEHIVSDCGDKSVNFANDNFYVPGSKPEPEVADETWMLIVGKGKWYSPPVGESAFREAIDASPNKIIRRVCMYCESSHKDIYYKRITEIPPKETYDFLANFMDDWFSTPSNLLGVDFDLYSSYEDAIAEVGKWTFCNYNDNGVGFPRDCGKTGRKNHNWNSYRRSNWRADTHAFFVEKPVASDVA